MKKQRRYILNVHTGVLHRFPANEACNLDAIPRRSRFYLKAGMQTELVKMNPKFKRLCRRCF